MAFERCSQRWRPHHAPAELTPSQPERARRRNNRMEQHACVPEPAAMVSKAATTRVNARLRHTVSLYKYSKSQLGRTSATAVEAKCNRRFRLPLSSSGNNCRGCGWKYCGFVNACNYRNAVVYAMVKPQARMERDKTSRPSPQNRVHWHQ